MTIIITDEEARRLGLNFAEVEYIQAMVNSGYVDLDDIRRCIANGDVDALRDEIEEARRDEIHDTSRHEEYSHHG